MPTHRPLLFRQAEPMISAEALPGRYDDVRSVWIVDAGLGTKPVVELRDRTPEIQTKTKVLQEVDDEIPGMLQMMTKTFVAVERDEDDGDDVLH